MGIGSLFRGRLKNPFVNCRYRLAMNSNLSKLACFDLTVVDHCHPLLKYLFRPVTTPKCCGLTEDISSKMVQSQK